MPISSTATSCSGPRRSSVSGRPISLFSLPSLRSTVQRWASISAICSLVDVLASDPVMPTTSGAKRSRQTAAAERRATPASATWTTLTPGPSPRQIRPRLVHPEPRGRSRRPGRRRPGSAGRRCVRREARRRHCRGRRGGNRRRRRGSAPLPARRSVPPTAAANPTPSKLGRSAAGAAVGWSLTIAGHSRTAGVTRRRATARPESCPDACGCPFRCPFLCVCAWDCCQSA